MRIKPFNEDERRQLHSGGYGKANNAKKKAPIAGGPRVASNVKTARRRDAFHMIETRQFTVWVIGPATPTP